MRWIVGAVIALLVSGGWFSYAVVAGSDKSWGWMGAVVYALIVAGIVFADRPQTDD